MRSTVETSVESKRDIKIDLSFWNELEQDPYDGFLEQKELLKKNTHTKYPFNPTLFIEVSILLLHVYSKRDYCKRKFVSIYWKSNVK
jgi:hypothetical protein